MKLKIKLMYKLVLPFLLFFIMPDTVFGQINISGQIKNKANKSVELVEVQLQNKDSIVVKSDLTDADGKFKIETKTGSYLLIIKQLGLILYKHKIAATADLNMGIIQITEKEQQLNEVVVTQRKKLIVRKVDRLIFNVENSIAATGGDAVDALKVTPGIKVQNDKIAMIGKSGMAVMVDDRLMQLGGDDLINFLKTIPADNIKSIEVITTPPAKYSAEGNSGIVNIKLKKAKKDSWSAAVRSSYKQATYSSERIGANLMYQKNKLGVLFDLSGSKGKNIYTNDIKYQYPSQNWTTIDYIQNNDKGFFTNLSTDFKATEKLKVGFQYIGGVSNNSVKEEYQSSVYNYNSNHLDQFYNTNGNSYNDYNNHSINLNLIKKIDTIGKQFTVDFDFYTRKKTKENPFKTTNNDYLLEQTDNFYTLNNSANVFSNYSAKIDFEMPIKTINLNYGGKISFTTNDSEVKGDFYKIIGSVNNPYLLQSNVFNYKENNQAVYISADRKLGKKWEAKAGLRIEVTQTTGFSATDNQTNKNNYTKIFPTAYLSYKPNDNHTFSINYARRIQRPNYSELNPARWYQNLNSYEVGNPFLQPSFADNIELSHSYKDLLTSTISFSKIIDGYGQLTLHDIPNNFQMFVRQNYYNEKDFYLSESLNTPINKWWVLEAAISAFYGDTNTFTTYLLPRYTGWGADFEATNSFDINKPKTFTAQVKYNYNFRTRAEESIIEPNSNFEVALKYALLSKKLQLSLAANNIFKNDYLLATNNTQNIKQSYNQYYDSHFFRFSMSYKFGNSLIKVSKRDVGNQEEKNRSN